jgi:hypothetical protein
VLEISRSSHREPRYFALLAGLHSSKKLKRRTPTSILQARHVAGEEVSDDAALAVPTSNRTLLHERRYQSQSDIRTALHSAGSDLYRSARRRAPPPWIDISNWDNSPGRPGNAIPQHAHPARNHRDQVHGIANWGKNHV